MREAVDGLHPRGYTPIGNALRQANDLLPSAGQRSVVLVSDGIDTCAPPPVCDVARELKAQGTDLVVHTIGFKIDDAARAELSCVAEATGGTYADASTKQSSEAVLTKATKRTGVGYQLPETVITAGADAASAPEIPVGTIAKPARFRLDTLSATDEGKHGQNLLKVRIPKGHRLHIGGLAVPEMRTGTGMLTGYSFGPKLRKAKDPDQVCAMREGGDLILAGVERPISFFASSKLHEQNQDCQEGETQFFAVPVQPGQSVAGAIEILEDQAGQELRGKLENVVRKLEVWSVNEFGQKQQFVGETTAYASDLGERKTFASKYDISYANIDADGTDQAAFWLGGTHYVAVSFTNFAGEETDAQTQLVPVKYRLTVAPQGTAVPGPKFSEAVVGSTQPEHTTAGAAPNNQR